MNAYLFIGIGSVHRRIGDILAYLLVWTTIFISKPSSIGVLTLTFSQYFLSGVMDGKTATVTHDSHNSIHLDCGPPPELVKMLAIFAIRRSNFFVDRISMLCVSL